MIPPVVAAPPSLWVARPPSLYSHRMRVLRHCLREHTAPYAQQLQRMTALRSLRFPELRLVQFDSGTRRLPFALLLGFGFGCVYFKSVCERLGEGGEGGWGEERVSSRLHRQCRAQRGARSHQLEIVT